MVGGEVKEIIAVGDKLWVNVRGTRTEAGQECAIYVKPTDDAMNVCVGDTLWWQGGWALWTPKDRSREDVKIPRIGYSGVRRPRVYSA